MGVRTASVKLTRQIKVVVDVELTNDDMRLYGKALEDRIVMRCQEQTEDEPDVIDWGDYDALQVDVGAVIINNVAVVTLTGETIVEMQEEVYSD